MANSITTGCKKRKRDSLKIELIPVEIDPEEAAIRSERINDCIARIILQSHKRGRKKKDDEHEEIGTT